MRTILLALVLVPALATPAEAQYADQKALEAAVRALYDRSQDPLIVSPDMVAPNIEGNVRIDGPNREALETRFGARLVTLEDAVSCQDLARPETCSVLDGGTIYQFFMPEPLRNGVLQLAVMLLKSGAGEGGQIGREWWNLALVRQGEAGWTVADKALQDTADGPW